MTSLLSNLLNYGVISPEERKRQLFKACWDGEIEQLKRLLSQSPDLLNERVDMISGKTLLMTAIFQGHENIVEYLLQQPNIDPHKSIQGRSALTVAIEMNRTQAVRALLARGPVDLTSPLETLKKRAEKHIVDPEMKKIFDELKTNSLISNPPISVLLIGDELQKQFLLTCLDHILGDRFSFHYLRGGATHNYGHEINETVPSVTIYDESNFEVVQPCHLILPAATIFAFDLKTWNQQETRERSIHKLKRWIPLALSKIFMYGDVRDSPHTKEEILNDLSKEIHTSANVKVYDDIGELTQQNSFIVDFRTSLEASISKSSQQLKSISPMLTSCMKSIMDEKEKNQAVMARSQVVTLLKEKRGVDIRDLLDSMHRLRFLLWFDTPELNEYVFLNPIQKLLPHLNQTFKSENANAAFALSDDARKLTRTGICSKDLLMKILQVSLESCQIQIPSQILLSLLTNISTILPVNETCYFIPSMISERRQIHSPNMVYSLSSYFGCGLSRYYDGKCYIASELQKKSQKSLRVYFPLIVVEILKFLMHHSTEPIIWEGGISYSSHEMEFLLQFDETTNLYKLNLTKRSPLRSYEFIKACLNSVFQQQFDDERVVELHDEEEIQHVHVLLPYQLKASNEPEEQKKIVYLTLPSIENSIKSKKNYEILSSISHDWILYEDLYQLYEIWLMHLPFPLSSYDIFINYRVNEKDSYLAEQFFISLSKIQKEDGSYMKVFYDKIRLPPNGNFHESLMNALIHSKVIITIISNHSLQPLNNHNISMVDNYLLEWILALILKKAIFPVIFNDYQFNDEKTDFLSFQMTIKGLIGSIPEMQPSATIAKSKDLLSQHHNTVAQEDSGIEEKSIKSLVNEVTSFQGLCYDENIPSNKLPLKVKDVLKLAGEKILLQVVKRFCI
eukprot:gene5490-5896_t